MQLTLADASVEPSDGAELSDPSSQVNLATGACAALAVSPLARTTGSEL
jgi:hypothetical protein